MSDIFINHSTKNHAETEVMATWLKTGHTSYFIDYDKQSGIHAGAHWAQVESKWCFGDATFFSFRASTPRDLFVHGPHL